jgi:hypothetical protein
MIVFIVTAGSDRVPYYHIFLDVVAISVRGGRGVD